ARGIRIFGGVLAAVVAERQPRACSPLDVHAGDDRQRVVRGIERLFERLEVVETLDHIGRRRNTYRVEEDLAGVPEPLRLDGAEIEDPVGLQRSAERAAVLLLRRR